MNFAFLCVRFYGIVESALDSAKLPFWLIGVGQGKEDSTFGKSPKVAKTFGFYGIAESLGKL